MIYDLTKGFANPDTLERMTDHLEISLAMIPSGTAGSGVVDLFIGPCSVIDLSLNERESPIHADEIKASLDALHRQIDGFRAEYYSNISRPTKLLIKTSKPDRYSGRGFSKEALHIIIAEGYTLLGVDTNLLDSETGDAQNIEFTRSRKLPCLLNLDLELVEPGFLYTLFAAPMSLLDRDLVPVRPLLLTNQ
jgi:kynurenine formamidase